MVKVIGSQKIPSVDLGALVRGKASIALNLYPFVGEWHGKISLSRRLKAHPIICFYDSEKDCGVCITKALDKVPKSTFMLIYKGEHEYNILTALSHSDMEVSIKGTQTGLSMLAKSGSSRQSNKQRPALIFSNHSNLQTAIRQGIRLALNQTGGFGQSLHLKPKLPKWLNSLGWESDFGIRQNISHKLIYESVKSLIDAGVPLRYVLIDNGWQSVALPKRGYEPALVSFQADQKKFPRGLSGLVSDLKGLGISNVGISHAMMGAVGGIHPKLAKKYDLPPDSNGRYFLGYDLGRTFEFFCDFYRYIKREGISFIKVVSQGEIPDFCREGMDVTAIYQYLQEAIQAASSLQFNSAHMNAGCLNPANLFYWSTSQIAKGVSDLDLSSPEKMGTFIRNNLLVSLWLRHLMVPDYGSWMTKTPYSYPLAMFHALSGGLHSLGDLLGDVDKHLIEKLALPSGELAHADDFLTLSEDSLFVDPLQENKIYKAYLNKKFQGVLWVGNLTKESRGIAGYVTPSDVDGIGGDLFCVYSFKNHFVGTMRKDEKIKCRLKPGYSDIWTFSKIVDGIAVIGMPHFFLMSASIKSINLDDNFLHLSSSIYAPILIYSERKILEVRCDAHVIPWDYDSDKKLLMIDDGAEIVERLSEFTIYFE